MKLNQIIAISLLLCGVQVAAETQAERDKHAFLQEQGKAMALNAQLKLKGQSVEPSIFIYGSAYGDGLDAEILAAYNYRQTNRLAALEQRTQTLQEWQAENQSSGPAARPVDVGTSYHAFTNDLIVEQGKAIRKMGLKSIFGASFATPEIQTSLGNIYGFSRWASATTLWLSGPNYLGFFSNELNVLKERAAKKLENPEIRNALLVDPGVMLLALGAEGMNADYQDLEVKDKTTLKLSRKETDFLNKQIALLKATRSEIVIQFAEEIMRPLLLKYKKEYRDQMRAWSPPVEFKASMLFGVDPNEWNALAKLAIRNLERMPELLVEKPRIFGSKNSPKNFSCEAQF